MDYLKDFCFFCLIPHDSLKNITSQDTDGVVLLEKLKCFISDKELLKTEIPKYICTECLENLKNFYNFRLRCVENVTVLNEYVQILTTRHESFRYSFLTLSNIIHYKMSKMLYKHNENSLKNTSLKSKRQSKYSKMRKRIDDAVGEEGVHFLLSGGMPGISSKSNQNTEENEFEINIKEEEKSDENEEQDSNDNEENSNNEDPLQQPSESQIPPPQKRFKCPDCRKTFSDATDLTKHQTIHSSDRPFPCDICPKTFTTATHLKTHKRIHTGLKPYACDICGKTFNTSGYLVIHRRTHTGDKPFKCEVCNKTFCASTDLNSHKRIHNNERPYQCTVCLKAFTQNGHLSRHMLVHSGEKPYECEACDYKCSDSSNLKKHVVRTHAGYKFNFEQIFCDNGPVKSPEIKIE